MLGENPDRKYTLWPHPSGVLGGPPGGPGPGLGRAGTGSTDDKGPGHLCQSHTDLFVHCVGSGDGFPGVHTANAHFISSLLCDNYKSITLLKALQQRQLGHQLSSSAPWLGAHRK